jgi:hypothetical protein
MGNTYIRQEALPAIPAPIMIPDTRPMAEARDKIPIYFPRSRNDTISVMIILPQALIPPAPMP